jgi:hypothetical protein
MVNLHGKRMQMKMLIEFVERYLMRPKRLREAIHSVVTENDEILRLLKEYEDDKTKYITISLNNNDWAKKGRYGKLGMSLTFIKDVLPLEALPTKAILIFDSAAIDLDAALLLFFLIYSFIYRYFFFNYFV